MDTIIDMLFYIDIIVSLNSAYYNEHGELITNRRKIQKRYMLSWFILDLLSVFPFDLCLGNGFDGQNNVQSNYSGYFKITRLPRMYKLALLARMGQKIKKIKIKQFSEVIEDILHINSSVMRVLKFLLTVLICVHITACFWYYSAKFYDFAPNTWVYENDLLNSSNWMLYLISFYWAVSTISTVGFGDIHAYNELEMILSILWMIFGVGFYSFTVSSLSTLFGNLDTKNSHLQNRITFMDEFCAETHLPKQMKDKIRRVLEYNSIVNVFCQTERDNILLDIPMHLKYQIAESMYSSLRSKLNFFADKDQTFISTFIPKLQPLKVGLGEFIYLKGEYPHQVYFIVNGRVNMVVGVHAITFKTYVTGSYFGEIEIFDNSSRLHSARAEVECELLGIDYDVFRSILQIYPEYLEDVQQTSLEKMRREGESLLKLQELTGLPQHSLFFRKKRVQSMYKSVRQGIPVELIQIEEEQSFAEQVEVKGRGQKRAKTEVKIEIISPAGRRRSYSAKFRKIQIKLDEPMIINIIRSPQKSQFVEQEQIEEEQEQLIETSKKIQNVFNFLPQPPEFQRQFSIKPTLSFAEVVNISPKNYQSGSCQYINEREASIQEGLYSSQYSPSIKRQQSSQKSPINRQFRSASISPENKQISSSSASPKNRKYHPKTTINLDSLQNTLLNILKQLKEKKILIKKQKIEFRITKPVPQQQEFNFPSLEECDFVINNK